MLCLKALGALLATLVGPIAILGTLLVLVLAVRIGVGANLTGGAPGLRSHMSAPGRKWAG